MMMQSTSILINNKEKSAAAPQSQHVVGHKRNRNEWTIDLIIEMCSRRVLIAHQMAVRRLQSNRELTNSVRAVKRDICE